jgi:hypothetical protein
MSRAYRVSVAGSVERVVHIDDGVCTSLELLPILPKERMGQILGEELARRGFEVEGKKAHRKSDDGVTVEIDLESSTVTIRLDADLEIDIKRQRTEAVRSTQEMAKRQEKLQAELDKELEIEVEREIEAERQRTTKKLEGKLRDLRQELDGITNRVTADALKEKARQMGEIEELVEDAETGSLTIKVRL